MKATKDTDGTPLLFRPEKNAARLNQSAARVGIPEFPELDSTSRWKRIIPASLYVCR